jgi:hypothetical protein
MRIGFQAYRNPVGLSPSTLLRRALSKPLP